MKHLATLVVALMTVTLPAACPERGAGSPNRDPAVDSGGRQCATRKIVPAPVNYEASARQVVTYTFVASVLTEDCNLTGMNGPTMLVNVAMRQVDPNGRNQPTGVEVVNQEEESPYTYTWGMERGYNHELLGDASVTMTAGQIDDWDAGFIECQWLRNGRPFPANVPGVFRAIAPIRPNQETMVECYAGIAAD